MQISKPIISKRICDKHKHVYGLNKVKQVVIVINGNNQLDKPFN